MPITLPNGDIIPDPPDGWTPARRPAGRPALPEGEKFVRTKEVPFKTMRWSHDLVIDWMLQNPQAGQKELAAYFGYSETWISMVISSDAFQAKLAERRDEILDPAVKASIEERFRALAHHSLARLHEKLENPNVSDNLVLRSVELAAKALGLGARAPIQGPNVQIAIVVPPKENRYVTASNG